MVEKIRKKVTAVRQNGDVFFCVSEIGYAAFKDCTGLTSVVIPDSVSEIVSYAFEGCTGLTSEIFPYSIKGIDEDAF